jgi:hypothetical protein
MHKKRMAEIHVPEGARGQFDRTTGRGGNYLLAQLHPCRAVVTGRLQELRNVEV